MILACQHHYTNCCIETPTPPPSSDKSNSLLQALFLSKISRKFTQTADKRMKAKTWRVVITLNFIWWYSFSFFLENFKKGNKIT